jgi:hypothetical protein
MMQRRKLIGLSICATLLGACGDFKMESSALTARTANPGPGPDCASCHGYPLEDYNHEYHLEKTAGNRKLNGKITCLDCHSASIRFRAVTVIDSVFQDTSGEQRPASEYPNASDTTPGGRLVRSLPLLKVDTLLQHRPFPAPDRPGPEPRFQEFITSLAHMNGNVDVVFDSRNSRPEEFDGDSASFNPTQETCSAVACHPGPKTYSWGSTAKGLPVLKKLAASP